MNEWILRIMRIETARVKKPWFGTSILAAAVKEDPAQRVSEATRP
jgi:hypothetical protein